MSNISGNQFVYADLPCHVSDLTFCRGFHLSFHVHRGLPRTLQFHNGIKEYRLCEHSTTASRFYITPRCVEVTTYVSRTDWEGHFKFMILAFIFIEQKDKSSSYMQSKTAYGFKLPR